MLLGIRGGEEWRKLWEEVQGLADICGEAVAAGAHQCASGVVGRECRMTPELSRRCSEVCRSADLAPRLWILRPSHLSDYLLHHFHLEVWLEICYVG